MQLHVEVTGAGQVRQTAAYCDTIPVETLVAGMQSVESIFPIILSVWLLGYFAVHLRRLVVTKCARIFDTDQLASAAPLSPPPSYPNLPSPVRPRPQPSALALASALTLDSDPTFNPFNPARILGLNPLSPRPYPALTPPSPRPHPALTPPSYHAGALGDHLDRLRRARLPRPRPLQALRDEARLRGDLALAAAIPRRPHARGARPPSLTPYAPRAATPPRPQFPCIRAAASCTQLATLCIQVSVMAISNVVFAIAMMLVLLRITQYLSLISTRLFVMRRSASNALVMLKCANPNPNSNPTLTPSSCSSALPLPLPLTVTLTLTPSSCSSAASRPLRTLAPIPTFTLPTPTHLHPPLPHPLTFTSHLRPRLYHHPSPHPFPNAAQVLLRADHLTLNLTPTPDLTLTLTLTLT